LKAFTRTPTISFAQEHEEEETGLKEKEKS